MSKLQSILSTLEAIPAELIDEPSMPMATARQEAHDLQAMLDTDDTILRLLAVGLDPALVSALPTAIEATREAQSQWAIVRDRSKSRARRDREDAGIALRRDLVAACRWNLRDDERAQGVLDSIVQGDGLADLVQDLQDLAMLISRHPEHFSADETFDASMRAEQARSLASEIAVGTAGARATVDRRDTKRLRDRAFTYLNTIVNDIRSAGRYAFRDVPERLGAFSSAYRRRSRRAGRRRELAEAAAVDGGVTTADAATATG